MGDEAVAIHIYDNWFKPGTIQMRSEFDRFTGQYFSLLGESYGKSFTEFLNG